MILLPDYPDKVILAHRIRVERLALFGTLTLIGTGAWWLLPAMDGSAELLSRMGPVVVMFTAALLLVDLIEYGPVQRSRIGTAANVAWPAVLVFAGIAVGDLGDDLGEYLGKSDSLIAILIMFSIALVLWQVSNRLLGSSLNVRRYRGLTSLGALALSTALIFSLAAPIELFAIILFTVSVTMVPDLITKDEDHAARKKFGTALDAAESKLLVLRGQGISLEQASSILKTAREVATRYPDIEAQEMIVDNACMQLVMNPQQFDVIVTTNFSARRVRMIQNKVEKQFNYANEKAGELALKAKQISKKNILIAGGLPAQNDTYVLDQRDKKIIEKGFYDQANLIKPFIDFFYLDVLCGTRECELALNVVEKMNLPVLVGLHVKKNGKLPSNESISEVVKKCKNKKFKKVRI